MAAVVGLVVGAQGYRLGVRRWTRARGELPPRHGRRADHEGVGAGGGTCHKMWDIG